jgi:hypothetical protein
MTRTRLLNNQNPAKKKTLMRICLFKDLKTSLVNLYNLHQRSLTERIVSLFQYKLRAKNLSKVLSKHIASLKMIDQICEHCNREKI